MAGEISGQKCEQKQDIHTQSLKNPQGKEKKKKTLKVFNNNDKKLPKVHKG